MAKCVVCKMELRDETKKVYMGDPMHAIIGPGFKNQLTPVRSIWCPRCGIKYHSLPVEGENDAED